jgi:hypothetical protein
MVHFSAARITTKQEEPIGRHYIYRLTLVISPHWSVLVGLGHSRSFMVIATPVLRSASGATDATGNTRHIYFLLFLPFRIKLQRVLAW